MPTHSITLTMIVKNGADKLARCLTSVSGHVDDMVVVDTGSTDNTIEVAQSHGARVFEYEWRDHFADARNFALGKSNAEWNLVLDHDEWLDPQSGEALAQAAKGDPAVGIITILSTFDENGETRVHRSLISRLLPRGTKYEGRIHEQVVAPYPDRITGIIVHHDGYFHTDKSERNLRLLERALQEQGEDSYILYQIGKQYRVSKQNQIARQYLERAYLALRGNEAFKPTLVVELLYCYLELSALDDAIDLVELHKSEYEDFTDFRFVCGLLYMRRCPVCDNPLLLIEKEFRTCLALGDSKNHNGVVGAGSFLAEFNLGVFYEVTGDRRQASQMYHRAVAHGYVPAKARLIALKDA